MIVFLDTDILIDVALDRLPFSEPAAVLLDKLNKIRGVRSFPGMGLQIFTTWFALTVVIEKQKISYLIS